MKAIARDYAAYPREALVVSPDNKSRQEINRLIHHELQARGAVNAEPRAWNDCED
jgi:hypothetical protein